MKKTGGEQMTKIRVHEYAKKVDKPTKEIIDQLSKLNIEVANHMATLEDNAVSKLDGIYKKSVQGQQTQMRQQHAQKSPQGGQGSRPQGGQNSSRPSGQGQSRPAGQGQNRPSGQGQSRPSSPSQWQSRSQGKGHRTAAQAKSGSNITKNTSQPSTESRQR